MNLPGDFNESNALAALMMTAQVPVHADMVAGLDTVFIPGRMLSYQFPVMVSRLLTTPTTMRRCGHQAPATDNILMVRFQW